MKKILCLALLSVGPALLGAPISGLFNTGVDNLGNALVGGNGTTDPNYKVVSTPGGPTNAQAVTYFNPAYIPEGSGATSRWISVNANGSTAASGTYIFEIQFNLSGVQNPLTAQISGEFAADNSATILLNGVTVGGASASFTSYSPFTINSNFQSGTNSLQFVVVDSGQPMALRVNNLSGSVSETPEPSAFALLFSGLALLSVRQFRKR